MRLLLALPILALASLPAPTNAATITDTFAIGAANFTDVIGSTTPPVDPASLIVSLTFDPSTGDQFDSMVGVKLISSSVSVPGGLAFDYDSVNDVLTFGGAGLGGVGIEAGTADLLAVIDTPYTGAGTFGGFIYASTNSTGLYESFTGSVAVPEPRSIALLLAGIGLALAPRLTRRR